MAITGQWRAKQTGGPLQSGALKWGTGINPVHSIENFTGRQSAPDSMAAGTVPLEVVDAELGYRDDMDYLQSSIFGYTDDTGLADRPRLGTDPENYRGDVSAYRDSDFPSWGPYDNGVPGGSEIRSYDHGAAVSKQSKNQPSETVTEGWRNKEHGDQNVAETSDSSQYEMQTSMTQRDKVRAGSQTSGRADQHSAPIRSRVIGIKEKLFSGGERHYDMTPRTQDPIVRGWWSRIAGTGNPDSMKANEQLNRGPITRVPPSDPYAGQSAGSETVDSNYGYVAEDMIAYA